jgi:hypothetical protein
MTPRHAPAPLLLLPSLLCALALAGCASREERVRAGLVELGLDRRAAACLAGPLARDLDAGELRRLAALARAARPRDGRAISLGDLPRRLAILEDPHVLAVASRAALGCALSF